MSPSYDDQPVPSVTADGAGLSSVLAYLAANRSQVLGGIVQALRSVVPIVHGLRFPRAAVDRPETEVITVDGKTFTRQTERRYWGNALELDIGGPTGIPASMISEGTLLVLGILTALMGPEPAQLVLLDDIDRGLHPKAQRDLVAVLRRLMEHRPELQIVATSHSPYLLDCLRPEEVRLTTLRDDGTAVCGRLDEHPEFEKWKESMTPGEFWSTVGEQWLAPLFR